MTRIIATAETYIKNYDNGLSLVDLDDAVLIILNRLSTAEARAAELEAARDTLRAKLAAEEAAHRDDVAALRRQIAGLSAQFEKAQRRVEFLERRLSQLTRDNLIDSEAQS